MKHELAVAKEVAKYFPEKPQEWDEVANILSKVFSTDDKQVEVKEGGCREKINKKLEKYKSQEAKAVEAINAKRLT